MSSESPLEDLHLGPPVSCSPAVETVYSGMAVTPAHGKVSGAGEKHLAIAPQRMSSFLCSCTLPSGLLVVYQCLFEL